MLLSMAKTTKASGQNIAENERNTTAVKLRLEPDAAEDLSDFAKTYHTTRGAVVDAAMMIIYRLNEGDLSDATGQEIYQEFIDHLGWAVGKPTQRQRDEHMLDFCAEMIAKRG